MGKWAMGGDVKGKMGKWVREMGRKTERRKVKR